jgi:hypothetical protein
MSKVAVLSYVSFTDQGSSLMGFSAKDQAVSYPKIATYDVR